MMDKVSKKDRKKYKRWARKSWRKANPIFLKLDSHKILHSNHQKLGYYI